MADEWGFECVQCKRQRSVLSLYELEKDNGPLCTDCAKKARSDGKHVVYDYIIKARADIEAEKTKL